MVASTFYKPAAQDASNVLELYSGNESPTCNKLEGPGRYLLARARHTNDHRLPPALVCALQGLSHDIHIADAFKGVVDSPNALFCGHFYDDINNGLIFMVLRVDAVCATPLLGSLKFARVHVYTNDLAGADVP